MGDCGSEGEIRQTLRDLPKDLPDTYARCVQRITSLHAPTILKWLCVAPKPFQLQQLREALAIDHSSGRINTDRIPAIDDVVKCCSNLIVQNSNDEIVFAHHSIIQFILSTQLFMFDEWKIHDPSLIQIFFKPHPSTVSDYVWERVRNKLARLCVQHLTSSDYDLSVQRQSPSENIRLGFQPVSLMNSSIPFVGGLFRSRKPQSKPVYVNLSGILANNQQYSNVPSFFYFSRDSWAPLTRAVKILELETVDVRKRIEDKLGVSYERLALQPNLTYQMHPWRSLGNSLNSHFAGLLGYSIAEHHDLLLDLFLTQNDPKPRKELFDHPLQNYDNLPPLHLAFQCGNIYACRHLFSKCDATRVDSNRRTILHHAAFSGKVGIIMLDNILKKGVKIRAKDSDGWTALGIAANRGHADIVDVLIKLGADINSIEPVARSTPLILAAANGHTETVRKLLEAGSNMRALDEQERTALVRAAENGNTDVVGCLLMVGPTGMVSRNDALSKALQNGHAETVRIFIKLLGFSIFKEEYLLAVARQGYVEVVKVILDMVPLDLSRTFPSHSLLLASSHGQTKVVEALLEAGVESETKDYRGNTALSIACQNGNEELARMLIEHGANIEERNGKGETPLLCACSQAKGDILPLLIHSGVDLHARTRVGRTALICCARYGNLTGAQYLLNLGGNIASIDAKTPEGESAFSNALSSKLADDHMVRLLAEHGADMDDAVKMISPLSKYDDRAPEVNRRFLLAQLIQLRLGLLSNTSVRLHANLLEDALY